MKKKLVPLLACFIFAGCVNNKVIQPNTAVKFYTPSKLSVIEAGSKIYIQGLDDYHYKSNALKKGIKDYFKKDGIFSIVDNIKQADIVISMNTFYSYRKDDLSDTRYNVKYYVNTKRSGNSSQDYLVQTSSSSSTATLMVTASIYETKSLQPLAYFSIIPENTSTISTNEKGGMYNSSNDFTTSLTKEVIEKLNNLVTTKNKNVNVFLPKNTDPKMKSALLNGKFDLVLSLSKTILPSFSIYEVTQAKYDDIKKAASKKGSKVKARNLEFDLSNFYIQLMAKESTDISTKNIKAVYDGYNKILSLTKDNSLILACANSLGRIEFKANRLKINLGGKE
jgi:hypothetical protein